MVNIQFYDILGDERKVEIISSDGVPTDIITESDCQNLFLFIGSGIRWSSFNLFCKKIQLTEKQIDNFRKLTSSAWDNYLKKPKEVGWEG